MRIPIEQLQERYTQLSDDELLDLWNRQTLLETAQAVLKAELLQRGITPPEHIAVAAPEIVATGDVGPWVTIAQLTTASEAHILRARLESEDIPAILADEHLVTANWFLSNAVGGVRVKVPQAFARQAYAIINELETGNYDIPADTDKPVRVCPKCHSDNTCDYKRSWKISFLIFYLLHIPVPYYANEFKCNQCGHIWKQPPPDA